MVVITTIAPEVDDDNDEGVMKEHQETRDANNLNILVVACLHHLCRVQNSMLHGNTLIDFILQERLLLSLVTVGQKTQADVTKPNIET